MKRIPLFLLLAAFGLLIVYTFSGPNPSERSKRAQLSSSRASRPANTTPLKAIVGGNNSQLDALAVTNIEDFSVWMLSKSAKPYIHIASNLLSFGRDGSGILDRARITFIHEKEGELPPIEIVAARLISEFGGTPPRPRAGPMKAEDVTVTYRGEKLLRTSEIRVQIPTLTTTFEGEGEHIEPVTFSSPDKFTLSGDGIKGSGTGISGDVKKEEIIIQRDPFVEVLPTFASKQANHILVRSNGKSVIQFDRRWISAVSAQFFHKAFFRGESADTLQFLETNANEISALFIDSEGNSKSFQAREFHAIEQVSFRANFGEGTASRLDGNCDSSGSIQQFALTGPYHVDFKTTRLTKALPGFGTPENFVIDGRMKLIAEVLPSEKDLKSYHFTAKGRPIISFRDRDSGKLSRIEANCIEGWTNNDRLVRFEATGNVEITTDFGRAYGDTFSAHDLNTTPRAELLSTNEARVTLLDPDSPDGSRSLGEVFGKKFIFLQPAKESVEIKGKSRVHGAFRDRDSNTFEFRAENLDAIIEKRSLRLFTLDDNVYALSAASNFQLYGSKLVATFDKSATPGVTKITSRPTTIHLTGFPAIVEEVVAKNGLQQSVHAPDIEFLGDRVTALGPVEISVPLSSVLGSTIARPDNFNKSTRTISIGGTRLESLFDNEGRQTSARLFGPLSSRGDFDLLGNELALDFITGHHYLISKEGERVHIKSTGGESISQFMFEASRIDFDSRNESVVLASNGIFEIYDAGFQLGTSISANPVNASRRDRIRITATGRSEFNRNEAVFRDEVNAQGFDIGDKLLWKMESGLLSVAFNAERKLQSVHSSKNVTFEITGRGKGNCDELATEHATDVFELRSTPPRESFLDLGNIQFRGPWLRLNTKTYLVETGSASVTTPATTHPAEKTPAKSKPR